MRGAVACFSLLVALAGCADQSGGPAASANAPAHRLVTLAPAGGSNAVEGLAPDVLSVAALRACMAQKLQMQNDTAAAAVEHAAIETRRAALKEEQDALAARRASINLHSAQSVNGFNAALLKAQTDSNAFNEDVNASNGRVAAANEVVSAFNAQCAGHSFYQDDFDAAIKDFPGLQL